MTLLSEAVAEFLVADEWPAVPVRTEESVAFETVFEGSQGAWPVRLSAYDAFGQLVVESLLPFDVDTERAVDLRELVAAVNWQLITGAFQVDPASLELRFRNALLLADGQPVTPRLVKGLLYSNVLTVDRCWWGIAALVSGELGVAEVVAGLRL